MQRRRHNSSRISYVIGPDWVSDQAVKRGSAVHRTRWSANREAVSADAGSMRPSADGSRKPMEVKRARFGFMSSFKGDCHIGIKPGFR
jgi:hypothetical protein